MSEEKQSICMWRRNKESCSVRLNALSNSIKDILNINLFAFFYSFFITLEILNFKSIFLLLLLNFWQSFAINFKSKFISLSRNNFNPKNKRLRKIKEFLTFREC